MFISELFIENFRIFGAGEEALTLPLKPGLTALVGENDTGKIAIIDALRLALGTSDQEFFRMTEADLHQAVGAPEPPKTMRIRCKFERLSLPERAAFLEYLTFELPDTARVPVLYVNWMADKIDLKARHKRIASIEIKSGLQGDGPHLDSEAKDRLCATYLRPLRDAERSLAAGRGSRLSDILENTKGITEGNPYNAKPGATQDYKKLSIVGIGELADDLLNHHEAVKKADEQLNTGYLQQLSFRGSDLQGRIAVGGAERSQDIRLRQLLEKLDLRLQEDSQTSSPVKRGLGSNNLLFMACELLLLGDDEDSFPILLIEEPEAHLHPQRQLLLMKFLQQKADEHRQDDSQIQIIVTTHSPNLASAIHVENLVLLQGGKAFSLAPACTNLEESDYKFLQRFLDVTKANMFFARGLMIVEGDAENILLPTIANLIGRDFAENGVSIVNVGGTGLSRFARIYQRKHSTERIGVPVACVTDFDVMPDCAPEIVGKVASGKDWPKNRQWRAKKDFTPEKLEQRRTDIRERASGQNVETFVSDEWTLEYDLAFCGLGEHVWIAAKLAKSDEQINGRKRTVRSVIREARQTYKQLRLKNLPREQLASMIYAEFTTGSKASKPTAAQYLASVLQALQNSRKYKRSPDDIRKKLPQYLLSAIDYVTQKGEEKTEKIAEAVDNA